MKVIQKDAPGYHVNTHASLTLVIMPLYTVPLVHVAVFIASVKRLGHRKNVGYGNLCIGSFLACSMNMVETLNEV